MTTFQGLLYQTCGRGGNRMLKSYEILGTDKPIFREKELNDFFLDELTHLNENRKKYRLSGYVQVIKQHQLFYKPVYSLTKSYLKFYNKGNNTVKRDEHARIIRFPQKNV
mgnify:CR=1 FL=1